MRLVTTILLGLLTVGWLPAQETPASVTEGRDTVLQPCDEAMDQGRRGEARNCYSRLLNGSGSSLVKAEAAWALQDMHRANELFRQAVAQQAAEDAAANGAEGGEVPPEGATH